YVMPGFVLAKKCADAHDAVVARGDKPTVIVLEKHGVFSFGETAKGSYDAMVDAVTRAERYLADARRTVSITEPKRAQAGVELALVPRLRGALARLAGEPPERGPMLTVRSPDQVLAFLQRPDAAELVQTGPA